MGACWFAGTGSCGLPDIPGETLSRRVDQPLKWHPVSRLFSRAEKVVRMAFLTRLRSPIWLSLAG
jgi:hypothetical protein